VVDPVIVGPIISGALAIVAATVGGILAFFAGRSRAEHEIRFSQLYQRKAEALAELYGLLYDVEESVTRLTPWSSSLGSRRSWRSCGRRARDCTSCAAATTEPRCSWMTMSPGRSTRSWNRSGRSATSSPT
jgi:hypothetical protein